LDKVEPTEVPALMPHVPIASRVNINPKHPVQNHAQSGPRALLGWVGTTEVPALMQHVLHAQPGRFNHQHRVPFHVPLGKHVTRVKEEPTAQLLWTRPARFATRVNFNRRVRAWPCVCHTPNATRVKARAVGVLLRMLRVQHAQMVFFKPETGLMLPATLGRRVSQVQAGLTVQQT